MIHRHWCPRCRKVNDIISIEDGQAASKRLHRCTCGTPLVYLESVLEPNDPLAPPTADKPQRPPSREEWYDSGYAPGTYEPRFAGPEWLPCWSDPSYVPKHYRLDESGRPVPLGRKLHGPELSATEAMGGADTVRETDDAHS